jgi:hypothetical protein
VEFESEVIWCIGLSSAVIRGSESSWVDYFGCLYPDIVPLGICTLDSLCYWVFQLSCVDFSSARPSRQFFGSVQLSCGVFPKLVWVCDCPLGPVSGWRYSLLVGRLKKNMVRPSWCLGCLGCFGLHTAPTDSSIHKSVNFGIHCCFCVPRLFLCPSSLLTLF